MSQVDTLRKWRDQASSECNYVTAALVADKIVAMTKESSDAFAFGKVLFDQQQFLRAAHMLSRPEFVNEIRCRRLAARSYLAAEKLDEALALVLDSDSQLSYFEGEVWSQKSNFDRAKAAFLRALALDPCCYEAYDKLCTHKLLDQFEERELAQHFDFGSMGHCADLVKSLYLSKLSSSFISLDLVRDALSHFIDVYDLSENSEILRHKIEMLFTQCKFLECIKVCEQVIEQDPHYLAVYPPYIGALYELGESQVLFKVSHKLAEEAPNNAITWIAIGTYYLRIENPGEARRNFSKATMLDPLSSTAWLGFANTFAIEGEHERSITAYATACRLFPGAHQPYMFLGMQYLLLNNLNLASEYLTKAAVMCEYNDPLVLNELAVLNYHRNDLITAKELIDKSLQLIDIQGCDVKTLALIRANLGYIYNRMGLHSEALQVFEEVSRASPGDTNIWTALGLVHLNLGDKDTAITFFHNVLGVKRTDPVAADMLSKAMKQCDPIEQVLVSSHLATD